MGKISFRPQLVAAAMLSAVLAGSFPVTAFANTGNVSLNHIGSTVPVTKSSPIFPAGLKII